MKIATVLKGGGEYGPEHVEVLHDNILRKLNWRKWDNHVQFVCLTDMDVPYQSRPLKDDLRGWWSKLELFRPGQFGDEKVLYFDIDTIVLDDFSFLFDHDGEFCMLRDFYHPHLCQSSVMIFRPEHAEKVWEKYRACRDRGEKFQRPRFRGDGRRGDQTFIAAAVTDKCFFQDLWPGRVVSYKVHCCDRHKRFVGFPERATVVCFHGRPRPFDTEHWGKY